MDEQGEEESVKQDGKMYEDIEIEKVQDLDGGDEEYQQSEEEYGDEVYDDQFESYSSEEEVREEPVERIELKPPPPKSIDGVIVKTEQARLLFG